MPSLIESHYDHAAELQAFDETKAGVKGLVDAGISTIPPFFIHSHSSCDPSLPLSKPKSDIHIPIIDLSGVENDLNSRTNAVERIRYASETWGFFQVVNHGIPDPVSEEMLEGVRRFFEQDIEVKKGYYSRDYVNKKVAYNSNYNLFTQLAARWRDTLFCRMAPNPPNPEDLPAACRDILIEYSKQVMRLGGLLMELLSEALGLNPSHLNDMDCKEGLAILGHYYPACPQPEPTIGTPRHTDDDFITVLLQDKIGGLQVLHQNQWFDFPYVPKALVINIGDLLQLISKDKFKSVEHRVLANKVGPRLSVSCFLSTSFQPSSKVYGPIKELLSEYNPPKYQKITVNEYVKYANSRGLNGTSPLLKFKI